jgi:hypothetical protein
MDYELRIVTALAPDRLIEQPFIGASDADWTAQNARHSTVIVARIPWPGKKAYHRASTARAPRSHGRLEA